jgi:hypothetical protein
MSEWFDKVAENDRAKKLRHACPECGSTMRGTGKLYYVRASGRWFIEYLCAHEQELFPIWVEETQKLAEEWAAE